VAEELRFFLRIALYAAGLGIVYWLVSYEPAGTVLLVILAVALATFLVAVAALEPRAIDHLRPAGRGLLRRAFGGLNRLLGFHDPAGVAPPLESGPELVPLSSPWPIVTAVGFVVIGLGLIFGAWLLVPGLGLLVLGGVGWLTQLDRVER
jgi:hypothetical protein